MRKLALALSLLVLACGTDDEGGFDPDYCPPVENWDPAWVALEDEVRLLVNERRSEGGTCGGRSFDASAPLATDSALRCAARNHSRDMSERGYFAHETPEGEDFADRIELQGVKGNFPYPDFSFEYRYGGEWGYVELAGIARYIEWEDTVPDLVDLSGDTIGWRATAGGSPMS